MVTKLKPGVGKIWLYLLAGGMWSAVGVILVRLGLSWIIPLEILSAVLIALVGFTLALPIYRLGFYRFAQNNINRIAEVASEKVCVFAFQAWTSYPLVVLMISLGVFLRKYSPIKPLLWLLSPHAVTPGGVHVLRIPTHLATRLRHLVSAVFAIPLPSSRPCKYGMNPPN